MIKNFIQLIFFERNRKFDLIHTLSLKFTCFIHPTIKIIAKKLDPRIKDINSNFS